MIIPKRSMFAGVVALAIGIASCGSNEQAAEPIVFSAEQSTLSSRTAGAAETAADAATADNKMAVAPGAPSVSVEYEVGGDLPELAGKAQSWKSEGAPTKKRMQAVAKALGVEGDLIERKKDEGGGFVVGPTDGSAPSVSFGDPEFDPYLNWYYSSAWATSSRSSEPAVAPDTAVSSDAASDGTESSVAIEAPDEMKKPENLPTKDEARERAKSIMDDAGVDIRDDDIEVYADDWSVSVTAWQRVGDIRAPMSWTFGFGDGGTISWAGGNLLEFEKGPKFPRVGSLVGVERLGDPKFSGWYGYGPVGRGVTEPAIAEPAISEDSMAVAPTVQTVVITGVKEALTPIIDADNVMWLVPSYEYTVKDGYTISVLAITDEFIEQAVPTPDTEIPGDGAVVEPMPALSQEEAVTLVGLTEEEATKVAESKGWMIRVSSRDGEDFQMTMDYVTNRVNLAIVDGKVTGVSVG